MNTYAVTQSRVARSEWIKFRSVRSTLITFAAAVIVAVGLGLLFSALVGNSSQSTRATPDSLSLSLAGFSLAQLIIGVLGVLIVASEYSTGLMRTTLAAVTKRMPVLWAKVGVYATLTFGVMVVAAVATFLGGQALYAGKGATVSLSDGGVLRAVIGAAVYITGVGVMGVALGFIMRSTAAAIGVLFAGLLLIPGLAGLLPGSFGHTLTKLLPSNAGQAFMSIGSHSDLLSPLAGFAVFAVWLAGMLAGAAFLLRRRDA